MKNYSIQYNVGSVKYLVSWHEGIRKNKDGSLAEDIRCCKNLKQLKTVELELSQKGFKRN